MSIKKITKGDDLTQSKDLTAENIAKLKELFPEIVTENKVDFKALQEILGEEVEQGEEYYRFTWAGKTQARREAHKPSTGTLRPAPEESVDWENTKNIYIEGDNLEVLKLLQKSYAGKIKMIYIDPPYNTGKDFVYKDNYKDNLKNYRELTGQIDGEGRRTSSNSEHEGRFHSNWLNMMYPRLRLARNLLTADGVIFVSIGVEEFKNLKNLLDEIFGEQNFVEIFSWVKTSTPPALSTKSRKTNEYILCYEKYANPVKYNGELLSGGDQPLLNSGNSLRKLKFPKDKVYFSLDKMQNSHVKKGKNDRVSLLQDLQIKNGYAENDFLLEGEFKWTQSFLDSEIEKGTTFIIKSDKLSIRFQRDEKGFKRPTNFIKSKYTSPLINKKLNGVGTNENASSKFDKLMGGRAFDNPKPTTLIKYLQNFITTDNDIILDFFSGSGTSAHAVFENNVENRTHKKFIQVQIPEQVNRKSTAHQIGYKTIAEIGKERIRRAAKKIKSDVEATIAAKETEIKKLTEKQLPIEDERVKTLQNEIKEMRENLAVQDFGFKVFKLDSTNMQTWDGDVQADLKLQLEAAVDNIKPDRTVEDLLYEILLKYGLDLTMKIEERTIAGAKVFGLGAGALFVCLDTNITPETAKGIGKWKEETETEVSRVVFRDAGFKSDVEKTNAVTILRDYGVQEVRSI